MGMYDDILCKYPLPLPEDTKGFRPFAFQTKELNNALDCFEIREDGTIWLRESERKHIEGNPNGKTFLEKFGRVIETKVWWTQLKITQTITMYTYEHGSNQYDYWVEFIIQFVNGVIFKVELKEFTAEDNTERKENFRKHIEEIKQRKKFESTLFYKLIGNPYNRIVKFSAKSVYRFASFLMGISWKLESKLLI